MRFLRRVGFICFVSLLACSTVSKSQEGSPLPPSKGESRAAKKVPVPRSAEGSEPARQLDALVVMAIDAFEGRAVLRDEGEDPLVIQTTVRFRREVGSAVLGPRCGPSTTVRVIAS